MNKYTKEMTEKTRERIKIFFFILFLENKIK
jgi:hypothetical protein